MFSVPHLIIIFAVALMVFGPEKLPELARNLGKIMGEFRRATGELRSTFEGHMRDLEREAELRRIREAQPPAQTIGGAAAAPDTPVLQAESTSDPLPPAPGTVSTEAPNSFASRESQAPEPSQSEVHERDNDPRQGDHPDSVPEKVTDGRPRPA
jgi:sec-independent protein translocase protein TatB